VISLSQAFNVTHPGSEKSEGKVCCGLHCPAKTNEPQREV